MHTYCVHQTTVASSKYQMCVSVCQSMMRHTFRLKFVITNSCNLWYTDQCITAELPPAPTSKYVSVLCALHEHRRESKKLCSPLAIQIQYISPNYFLISISCMCGSCRRKKSSIPYPATVLFDLSHSAIFLLLNWFFCIICIIKTIRLLGLRWPCVYLLHSGSEIVVV